MLQRDTITRVATSAIGALLLASVAIGAAAGPGHNVQAQPPVYAAVQTGAAHG